MSFFQAMQKLSKKEFFLLIVAALGYFVDIYDLILFSIIRKKSLIGLGVADVDCLAIGEHLISMQMFGMLVGGILWGILGDKKGRLSVLFGSIIVYSIANIANGMVHSIEAYSVWRFIAGVGLAGELGAGITLISESMSKETRGYGTMLVTTFGVFGGVVAGLIGGYFDWRTSYYIGGIMGLALLLLRVGVYESGMFKALQHSTISKGNFFMLFNEKKRFFKYLRCIIIGLPTWYFAGILITFSPEFSLALGIPNIVAGTAVMLFYGGLTLGDFASGYLSQVLKSRKQTVYIFMGIALLAILLYLFPFYSSSSSFYLVCGLAGFAGGYWAIFITIASEQFGTNLRATVTTTVPNFVRGALILLLLLFNSLKSFLSNNGILENPSSIIIISAFIVGVLCVSLALSALYGMEETYGKELNYYEE